MKNYDQSAPIARYQTILFHEIVAVVSTVCQIDPNDMNKRNFHPRIVRAKELVTVLARRHTRMSYPEIARALYIPNHSTVITAATRWHERVRSDQTRMNDLESACKMLGVKPYDLDTESPLSAKRERVLAIRPRQEHLERGREEVQGEGERRDIAGRVSEARGTVPTQDHPVSSGRETERQRQLQQTAL